MEIEHMQVLVFASQKGGSGKSTLAGHIAVQAELMGAGPVGVVDTDPQGSLAAWHEARLADTPRFVHSTERRLLKDIQKLRLAGVKLLVIDTPPAITSTIGHAINVADIVVIPSRPSPHDLRAAGRTVDIAERLDKPLVFVINGAHPRARITTEAAISLSEHGPLAAVVVHQRTDFAASMIDGRAVMEVSGRSRSPEEIAALWKYLKNRMKRNQRRAAAQRGPKVAQPKRAAHAAG
jgi:chromosome partitioning protein